MAQTDIWRQDSIEEVVVTGTGTRHLLKDAPVQTEVITQQMLSQYGGKSLEEILAGLTASFAFNEGDMGSQMQLNGLGNSYILILVDGKRIHGDVGGENDLGLIDPQNIEKIEIVKGAQSALYGSDAMAGVINIITKKHTEAGFYVDNSTRYGTHNDLRQHNTVAFTLGKFNSQTNFQLQRNDGWQNTAEEWAEGVVLTDSRNKTVNEYRNWQVAERLTYQPMKGLELYAEGSYYKKNILRPFSVAMMPGQSKLQSDQQRVMAQLKGIFNLPYDNMLNAGAEYRYDYLKAPERTETGTADDWTGAVYVQDEWNHLKWLNITAGLRLVDNHNFGFRLTPKVSTMASVGDFRFRLGWSQGFKTPTVKELHYRYLHIMGSSTFFNIGNVNLDPQTSNYYSANVEYRGRRFTAAVTGYLNKLDRMIALVNVSESEIPPGVTQAYMGDGSTKVQARMYKNMDDARTSGVDVTLSYRLLPELTLNGAYSYLDTKAHLYDEKTDRMTTVVIDGTAHHKWSASALYSHAFSPAYKLGVSLSTRGSSKRYYQNNGDGKGYQIWRISTTHDFPFKASRFKIQSVRLEFGVDNIFNYVDRTMHPYHLGTNTSGTTVYGTFSIKFSGGKRVKQNNILSTKQNNNDEQD